MGTSQRAARVLDALIDDFAWRTIARYSLTNRAAYDAVANARAVGRVHPRRQGAHVPPGDDADRCFEIAQWIEGETRPRLLLEDAHDWIKGHHGSVGVGAGCVWCARLVAAFYGLVCARRISRSMHTLVLEGIRPVLRRARCGVGMRRSGAAKERLVEMLPILGCQSFRNVLQRCSAIVAGGAVLAAVARDRDVRYGDVDVFVASATNLHRLITAAIVAWRALGAADARRGVPRARRTWGHFERHLAPSGRRCSSVYDVVIHDARGTHAAQFIAFSANDAPEYLAFLGVERYAQRALHRVGGPLAAFDLSVCAVGWDFARAGPPRTTRRGPHLRGAIVLTSAALGALRTGRIALAAAHVTDERVEKYREKGFELAPSALRWDLRWLPMHPHQPQAHAYEAMGHHLYFLEVGLP